MRRTPSTFVCGTTVCSSSALDSAVTGRARARGRRYRRGCRSRRALGDRAFDERAARRLVGDVERQRGVGFDPLDSPRTADDAHACLAELTNRCGADPRRGARDDGGLATELHRVSLTPNYVNSTRSIVISLWGRSRASRSAAEIRSTTSWPDVTRPKTVCLPSSQGVASAVTDEELRAVRPRARVRHRKRAAGHLVLVELVLERVPGAAGAVTLRAAALDHEVGNHPVEREPS